MYDVEVVKLNAMNNQENRADMVIGRRFLRSLSALLEPSWGSAPSSLTC